MRWFWIDRFESFVSGESARTVKNVTMSEEHLDDYSLSWLYMPASLMIEGLAQTGGLLLGQTSDFNARVVLAKIGKATFHYLARPGDRLTYEVQLVSRQADGAIAQGRIYLSRPVEPNVQRVELGTQASRQGQPAGTTNSSEQVGAAAGTESTLLGVVDLVFATLDGPEFEGVELFQPHEFVRMLRSMRLFEVARNPDGSPVQIPPHLLAAEQAVVGG